MRKKWHACRRARDLLRTCAHMRRVRAFSPDKRLRAAVADVQSGWSSTPLEGSAGTTRALLFVRDTFLQMFVFFLIFF
jgi:hypothetical protein